jgi:RNA polymerase sigma-70 factor (ECF subfamily)
MSYAVRAHGEPPDAQGMELPSDFDALYQEHFDFVWRSLRRLGVPLRYLDDAAQEVFLVVYRQALGFEGRSSFKTWIFGIAYHVALRTMRSDQRRREDVLEGDREDVRASSPHEALERAEAVRRLYALLDKLRDEQRAVFVMAELENMSAPEIAEIVQVPLNTVYSRLRAARKAFEAALKVVRAREDREWP